MHTPKNERKGSFKLHLLTRYLTRTLPCRQEPGRTATTPQPSNPDRLVDVEGNSLEICRQVDVVPATSDQSVVVANLFELYAHDFSDFHDVKIGEDGRFGFEKLSLFWSEPQRHALLLKYRKKLAGFALVTNGSEITKLDNVWDMAEFFVLRRYRRCGVGAEAARQIWRCLPGPWEIRVMESNHVAYRFWAQAVQASLGEVISPIRVEIACRGWYVFPFDSSDARAETKSST